MALNTVWFLLIAVLLGVYAVLDGFDLGTGILYPLLGRSDGEKRALLQSIGPFWDANEVWLLTAGGALFAAFPAAYASVFSGFYLAVILLVFALIARAIATEFRSKAPAARWQHWWDRLFSLASALASLLFGVALGNIARGIPLDAGQHYTGTFFGLLNPYALIFGLTGVAAFALQGATYGMVKLGGAMAERSRRLAGVASGLVLGLSAFLTAYTWMAVPRMYANFQTHPVLFLIPAAMGTAILLTWWQSAAGRPASAFAFSSVALAGMVATVAASLYPYLVPAFDPAASLTIYNAASSPLTLKVMLVIALSGLPFVIFYTAYVYRVFRGKTGLGPEGY